MGDGVGGIGEELGGSTGDGVGGHLIGGDTLSAHLTSYSSDTNLPQ